MLGLAIGEGGALMILDKADMAINFALTARVNPALIIHSADGTSANEYIELQHNGTNPLVNSGDGSLLLQVAGVTEVTIATTGITVADAINAGAITGSSITTAGTGSFGPMIAGSLVTTGDVTVGDQLIVSGTGPHAVGGATAANVQLFLRGTFTPSDAAAAGLLVGPTIVPSPGRDVNLAQFGGTITEAASGVHALLAALTVTPPTITVGAATVTDTATLYISAAPTATVSGNNYALRVAAGLSSFGGIVETASYIEIPEIADPGVSGANKARIYAKDSGTGKTMLVVQFPTGGPIAVVSEP